MSRADLTLEMLRRRPRCGQDLVEGGIGYRYSARIQDLRDRGFEIETRPCVRHEHGAALVEYFLVPAGQLRLV